MIFIETNIKIDCDTDEGMKVDKFHKEMTDKITNEFEKYIAEKDWGFDFAYDIIMTYKDDS